MVRSIVGVVVGFLVANVVTWAVELLSLLVYPLPAGLDMNDTEAVRTYIGTMPSGAFPFVLLAWFAGAFCGAWLAARIARRAPLAHALAIGVIQLAAGLYNLLTLPHPTWFWVAGLLAFPVAAVAAASLNRTRPVPAPVEPDAV
jgi:hypothetical protein